MPRSFLQRVGAAILVAGLLLPSAAMARGPHLLLPKPGGTVLSLLWDFVSSLWKSDNRGTIDPNGLNWTAADTENGSQIDPNGAKLSGADNRSQIDPDGLTGTAGDSGDNRGQMDPNG